MNNWQYKIILPTHTLRRYAPNAWNWTHSRGPVGRRGLRRASRRTTGCRSIRRVKGRRVRSLRIRGNKGCTSPLLLTEQTRHRQGGGCQKSPKCVIDKGGECQRQALVFDAAREYMMKTMPLTRERCQVRVINRGGVNDRGP
jgi:hypothetical protein